MEIVVLVPFMAFGKRQEAGQVINLPAADAAYVIGLGRAEKVEPAPVDEAPKAKRKAKD
jgi:hypothetical protein